MPKEVEYENENHAKPPTMSKEEKYNGHLKHLLQSMVGLNHVKQWGTQVL